MIVKLNVLNEFDALRKSVRNNQKLSNILITFCRLLMFFHYVSKKYITKFSLTLTILSEDLGCTFRLCLRRLLLTVKVILQISQENFSVFLLSFTNALDEKLLNL